MREVRFLIDWRGVPEGTVRRYSDDSAAELVEGGLAEYTAPHEKSKKMGDKAKSTVGKEPTFITEYSKRKLPSTRFYNSCLQAAVDQAEFEDWTPEERSEVLAGLEKIPIDDDALRVYIKERFSESSFKKIMTKTESIIKKKDKVDEKRAKEDKEDFDRKYKVKGEGEDVFTSSLIDETKKLLIEQVYDIDTRQCLFCYFDPVEKKVEYSPQYIYGGIKFVPHVGEEIQKKAVLLPSCAMEYENEAELDKKIEEFINKWLDVKPDFLRFALWNIKKSWVYERFHTINYLRALGDTGQGKTRFLDTLGSIHYKPIFTSGASSAAAIFRVIDKWRGTMVFDEADIKVTDETEPIIKIINHGYEFGKHIMRCDQDDANKLHFFDPYCPKLLATRRAFEDKAVESRCITAVMTGTRRRDIKFNLDPSFFEEARNLRNMLLMYRFKKFFSIDPNAQPDIRIDEVEPRVQQIINGYLSLFKDDVESLERFKQFIISYQEDLIEERQSSYEGAIVLAISELLQSAEWDIDSSDIIEKGQITNAKGQLVKARGITSHLKALGFGKPIIRRVGGHTKRCIPLDPEHLKGLFERYGVTVVTIVTGVPGKNIIEKEGPSFIKEGDLSKLLGKNVTIGGVSPSTVTIVTNTPIVTGPTIPKAPEEEVFEQQKDQIYLPCYICGDPKSEGFDETPSGKGRPICRYCKDSVQKHIP